MTISTPGHTVQKWCAASGYAFPILALIFMFGSGILPPQSPNHSAQQIAAWYQDGNTVKLAGFALTAVAVTLVAPLIIAVTLQMIRIEARSPAMSLLQFGGGMTTWVLMVFPMMILCAAAFRPDRDPQITQALSDLGYITFFMGFGPFAVQDIAIAVAVLGDSAAKPVYARWVGWFNLWVAVVFIPAAVIPFFKTGPFTYRGLFAFWLPTLIYGLWALVMAHTTRTAIRDQATDSRTVAGTAPQLSEHPA